MVFILNRFFAEMAKALVATKGHYAQFNGDGLMALYGLEDDDVVLLRLELPATLRGSEVAAKISLAGEAPIFHGIVAWDPNHESGGFLEIDASDFERDSYVIDLVSESGVSYQYMLDVR